MKREANSAYVVESLNWDDVCFALLAVFSFKGGEEEDLDLNVSHVVLCLR